MMSRSDKELVFISGPLTAGLCSENVRKANEVAMLLREAGYVPFIPHLFWFTELMFPRNESFWLEWEYDMLSRCDLVYRIDGESPGADSELDLAEELKIPVYYGEAGLVDLLESGEEEEEEKVLATEFVEGDLIDVSSESQSIAAGKTVMFESYVQLDKSLARVVVASGQNTYVGACYLTLHADEREEEREWASAEESETFEDSEFIKGDLLDVSSESVGIAAGKIVRFESYTYPGMACVVTETGLTTFVYAHYLSFHEEPVKAKAESIEEEEIKDVFCVGDRVCSMHSNNLGTIVGVAQLEYEGVVTVVWDTELGRQTNAFAEYLELVE